MTPSRVLVVDDHPEDVYELMRYLHERGYDPDYISDGQTAVRQLSALSSEGRAALLGIVCDWQMWSLQGHEVFAALAPYLDRLVFVLRTRAPEAFCADHPEIASDRRVLVVAKSDSLENVLRQLLARRAFLEALS